MAYDTDSTLTQPNAAFVRRSVGYPEYVLIRFAGSDRLAVVIATPVDDADLECMMVDGYVELPEDDIRHPGVVCEFFVVRDDGLDLDTDFESHADELAEETSLLVAQAVAEARD